MAFCQNVPQEVPAIHTSSLPPRRAWRTLGALQRDRADQQRLRRLCASTAPCRCHVVRASATQSQNVSLSEQTDEGSRTQPDTRFQGLGWVNDQESDMVAELHQEEQEQWLQSVQSVPPQQFRHIDEDQPERHKFHRRMMNAAARGEAADVSEILEEMQEDEIEPGPYAYHALVFAHVKNKDSDSALEVMRLMHRQGLQAVAQSYCALIHSFIRDEQPEHAMAVFGSMQRSTISAYPGWLTITNQLFAAGEQELAEQCVRDGQHDWQPDADLYEHIIKSVCSTPQGSPAVYTARLQDAPQTMSDPTEDSADPTDNVQEALAILAEVKARFAPEARHMNPILAAYASKGSSSVAEKMVQDMTTGRQGAPDSKSFELLAQAHIQSGKDGIIESMTNVVSLMTKAGLQSSRRFRMLMVEANLLENHLEDALAQFQMLRAAGRMRGVMRLMPDKVLASLLQKLSAGKMPAEVLRMLTAMSVDGRRMPAVDESIADSTARSFLTSWLAGPRLDLTASQGFEGVMTQPQEAADEVTEVAGVRILGGKYVVSDEGKIISPSALKLDQLKAELTARGLSSEGKRENLRRRVMAARNAEPPDMAQAIRKKQALQLAKRKKVEKAMKQEAASKEGEAAASGSAEDRRAKVQVMAYGSGKGTLKEEYKAEVEDEEEDVVEDDAVEAISTLDPMQASNTATAVDDDEYVVGDDDSAQDVLEDGNDTDDLPPSKGEGDIIREQTAVAAAVQRPFSNADAGADVAMQLLRLCESLGGSATAQDYEQILKVSEGEENAVVARNLTRSWHLVLQAALDQNTVSNMYNRAARVCINGSNLGLAREVIKDMQLRGIEIDSQLQADAQEDAAD